MKRHPIEAQIDAAVAQPHELVVGHLPPDPEVRVSEVVDHNPMPHAANVDDCVRHVLVLALSEELPLPEIVHSQQVSNARQQPSVERV